MAGIWESQVNFTTLTTPQSPSLRHGNVQGRVRILSGLRFQVSTKSKKRARIRGVMMPYCHARQSSGRHLLLLLPSGYEFPMLPAELLWVCLRGTEETSMICAQICIAFCGDFPPLRGIMTVHCSSRIFRSRLGELAVPGLSAKSQQQQIVVYYANH